MILNVVTQLSKMKVFGLINYTDHVLLVVYSNDVTILYFFRDFITFIRDYLVCLHVT